MIKNDKHEINPCGTYCDNCEDMGTVCDGCRNRNGKPIWYQLYNLTEPCAFYKCCDENKIHNCSACNKVPCNKHFKFPDPGMSDEDKEKWLELRMVNFMEVNKGSQLQLSDKYSENEKKYNK
ncbi:MAG: hypothetical protein K0S47_2065 [Herbinix sp.]|nr:hypothetical protein [Herbinix sp.]